MKKGLALVAFAFMSLLTTGSAFAGPFGRFRAPRQQQQQQQQRAGQQEDAREGDKERNEKNNPNQQQGPGAREGGDARQGGFQPGPGRAGARMSIEERQKLRRQINEAGRSLYTPPAGNK